MRALVLVLVSTIGCVRPAAFQCATDSDCTRAGEQGACEAIGRCSFPDPACGSGRRFAGLSGDQADQCVGDGATDGGVTDSRTDAGGDEGDAAIGDGAMADAPSGCPVTYVALAGVTSSHLYRTLPAAAGWTNQRSACGMEPANAYLAIPDDAVELQALITHAGTDVWVGISDAASEGAFVTVRGTPATYLPWATNEPDNNGNQDCVRTRSPSAIETVICGTPTIAICECEP